MTKTTFNKIKKEWNMHSDKERWLFLLDSQHLGFIVQLDNDDTFVIHPDIEDEYLQFNEYIGWSDGIQVLLNAINIKAEPV